MTPYRTLLMILAGLLWSAGAFAQQPMKDGRSALPWLKFEDLSATRDRPLFAPNRRPPAVSSTPDTSEQDVVSQNPSEPSFALRGVIVQPGETLILLDDIAASRSVIVRSGESYGRWRVLAESPERVTLTAGAEQIRLELFPP